MTLGEDVLVEIGEIRPLLCLWHCGLKTLSLNHKTCVNLCSTLNIIHMYMNNSWYYWFVLKGSEIAPFFSDTSKQLCLFDPPVMEIHALKRGRVGRALPGRAHLGD